ENCSHGSSLANPGSLRARGLAPVPARCVQFVSTLRSRYFAAARQVPSKGIAVRSTQTSNAGLGRIWSNWIGLCRVLQTAEEIRIRTRRRTAVLRSLVLKIVEVVDSRHRNAVNVLQAPRP